MKFKFLILFLTIYSVCASEELNIGFFGPYSQERYQKTERLFKLSSHEYGRCTAFFIWPGQMSSKNFWRHYRAYIGYQIDLEQLFNKVFDLESPLVIKKEALKEKEQMDELEKLIGERKK